MISSDGNSDLKVTSREARSDHYCDQGVGLGILLLTALGVGIMFFTLYTKVTMAMTARKKKSSEGDILSLNYLEDNFFSGNEIHDRSAVNCIMREKKRYLNRTFI